jgi:hypothetical protein
MTGKPSPEDSARRVLSVFQHHTLRSGQELEALSFVLPFDELGWETSDREIGLKHAIENGWIEARDNALFVLTDAGFAEIERGRRGT